MRRFAPLLLLLLLLAVPFLLPACPGTGGEPSPSPTPTPPGVCEGTSFAPIGLLDPVELQAALGAVMTLRAVPEIAAFPFGSSDPDCPSSEGDDPDLVDVGTLSVQGDCTDANGWSFSGRMELTWDDTNPDDARYTFTGTEFRFDSNGLAHPAGLSRLELDGVTGFVINDSAREQSSTLDGMFLVQGDDPDVPVESDLLETLTRFFPMGMDGTFSFAMAETAAGERFEVALDLEALCRSDLSGTWNLETDSTLCALSEPVSGQASLSADGHTVVFDFDADDVCDGCTAWTWDGKAQAPFCFD